MAKSYSVKDPRNLSILTDFYELTLANGVFQSPLRDIVCVYDVVFRRVPDQGGFAIFCGLEQAIEYLEKSDISNAQIATLVGFASENTFYRNFQKTTGVTPKTYRDRLKQ